MEDGKYNRSIALLCPTCGHKDFERDDEHGPIRCTSCDRVFTREELIRENGPVIEAEVEEVKAEVVADLRKHLHDSLATAFKGKKGVRFK
jgi:transcription initiation factor TFIIIB Brf1 subunit/transcription initiation factor TFIIB